MVVRHPGHLHFQRMLHFPLDSLCMLEFVFSSFGARAAGEEEALREEAVPSEQAPLTGAGPAHLSKLLLSRLLSRLAAFFLDLLFRVFIFVLVFSCRYFAFCSPLLSCHLLALLIFLPAFYLLFLFLLQVFHHS